MRNHAVKLNIVMNVDPILNVAGLTKNVRYAVKIIYENKLVQQS